MKTSLALERQRKVVFPLALRLVTARIMAGCYMGGYEDRGSGRGTRDEQKAMRSRRAQSARV